MRNQKGITLIALVITIIVLLILAGVTIAMLSGENGILKRATETRSTNAEAQAREEAKIAFMDVRTEIAAKKSQLGTYSPATNVKSPNTSISSSDKTLEDVVINDLGYKSGAQSGWTKVEGTEAANGIATITMEYTDSSLPNKLTYTITVKDTSPYAELAGNGIN